MMMRGKDRVKKCFLNVSRSSKKSANKNLHHAVKVNSRARIQSSHTRSIAIVMRFYWCKLNTIKHIFPHHQHS